MNEYVLPRQTLDFFYARAPPRIDPSCRLRVLLQWALPSVASIRNN